MDSTDIGQLTYLGILGSALVLWMLVEFRGKRGTMLRQMMAWGLIFFAIAAGYGLWTEIRTDLVPRQTVISDGAIVEVPLAQDGHYYLTLTVKGTPVRFMVDTGASNIVLSTRDTDRLGIDRNTLAFLGEARTANGTIRTARVTLDDVALDGFPEGRVAAWVGDGPLDVSLLGMEYLRRFERVEIARNKLILTR